MTEILVRRETADEQLALGATFLDDIDLILSPRDQTLVMVSVKKGRHVCQQCGGLFAEHDQRLRGVEVSLAPGSPRVLLHAKCEDWADHRRIYNVFAGLGIRRKLASAAKASTGIAHAALDGARKIVG
jgi:hypothetical protein